MTAADRIIRWTTALAVVGVAAVKAVASYEHAYALVQAHGEAGWTGHLVPLTVDGLIYASSMVMLDSARRKVPVPALARWLLGLGIAATLATNVAHGLGHGAGGSGVAGGRSGRLLRTPHGGHPEFSGANQRQVREQPRSGPATATRGRIVRRAPCGGPGSLSPLRSVPSRTSASHGHSGCGTTSRQEP
jgi:hypothetical protein